MDARRERGLLDPRRSVSLYHTRLSYHLVSNQDRNQTVTIGLGCPHGLGNNESPGTMAGAVVVLVAQPWVTLYIVCRETPYALARSATDSPVSRRSWASVICSGVSALALGLGLE